MRFSVSVFSLSLACLVGLSACNETGLVGQPLGQGQVAQFPSSQPVPAPAPTPTGTPTSSPSTIGSGCQSTDSSRLCLGLKYVVYTDTNGKEVASEVTAISNLAAINKVWAQCNIAFQIDEFLPEDPKRFGLNFSFGASDFTEMEKIRQDFQDSSNLLVVTTGSWNHDSSSANAWTAMPGDGIYGVVMESSVGDYPNIIGHELGHYLSLDHVSDQSDLMNPVIYDSSTQLTSSQCDSARATVNSYWKAMLR